MNTIKYQCNANNYCAARLWEIRSHIHGLCKSDQEKYNGDVIYRVVNGIMDENWLRVIIVLGNGRIIFRTLKKYVADYLQM